MSRRKYLIRIAAAALAPSVLFAQTTSRVPRVGFLLAESRNSQAARIASLLNGLRDLGYIDGKNMSIELRTAEGNYERLPELSAELVRLDVNVLVAFGAKAVVAAKAATTQIPIVVPATGSPIETGLTASFASPTANIVGIDNMNREVNAKRLQLLKELAPRISWVAVLVNPASTPFVVEAATSAAKILKLSVHVLKARTRNDIHNAFSSMPAAARGGALLIQQDTLFISHAPEIAQLAIKHLLPSASMREYAEVGGLLGYGVNDAELYRRSAYLVDRLLKGARPSELPFERASKFELFINNKTAKAIGISIPQSLQVRADKLIE